VIEEIIAMDTPTCDIHTETPSIELSTSSAQILIQIAEEFVEKWPSKNQDAVHAAIGEVREKLSEQGVDLD
jgi:hypothetical protein